MSELQMNPTAFISYSHDSKSHKEKALIFSNKLRSDGIDSMIDQYVVEPPEGWVRWMINQIKNSDYVFVICSDGYYERIFKDSESKGAKWESDLIYGELYKERSETKKFKPIIFNNHDRKWIPDILNQRTQYKIPEDYDKLYRELTNQPKIVKPELGQIKKLESEPTKIFPKEAKSSGIPQEIDENEYQFILNLKENFQPIDKTEILISNLISINKFPFNFYSADTDLRKLEELWERLEKIDSSKQVFLLKDKKIYGFQDFRDPPWDILGDAGTCDPINTNKWIFGENEDNRKKIFELFNLALKQQLYESFNIGYNAYYDIYYFNAIRGKTNRVIKYNSLKGKNSPVTVVKRLNEKNDNKYLRHHGFKGNFKKYIDKTFLEITPTYYFSVNGETTDKFYEDKIKKLKQLEKHVAVRNQILLWEDVLSKRSTRSLSGLMNLKCRHFFLQGTYQS